MNEPTTIPRAIPPEPIDNFDALKQDAIGWLAQAAPGSGRTSTIRIRECRFSRSFAMR